MSAADVILAGIPRSGTSLACKLLNTLPGCVALVEPMDVGVLIGKDESQQGEILRALFAECRRSLLQERKVRTKVAAGGTPENTFSHSAPPHGRRTSTIRDGDLKVAKSLTTDFLLAVKHPNAFTALLPTLVARFQCYAFVRNPLAVLASWNSLSIGLARGHAPMAEALAPDLAAELGRLTDTCSRQMRLLGWYFEQYRACLGEARIIRYETLVSSRGKALACVTPRARSLDIALENKNLNRLYDRDAMLRFGERLLASQGAYWHFYSRESVAMLLARVEQRA